MPSGITDTVCLTGSPITFHRHLIPEIELSADLKGRTSPYYDKSPEIVMKKVTEGDTISLYSDDSCTQLLETIDSFSSESSTFSFSLSPRETAYSFFSKGLFCT